MDWLSSCDKCQDPGDRPNGLSEDAENTTIQNPYYEGDDQLCIEFISKSEIIPNWNETEVVTSTKNLYYEM